MKRGERERKLTRDDVDEVNGDGEEKDKGLC